MELSKLIEFWKTKKGIFLAMMTGMITASLQNLAKFVRPRVNLGLLLVIRMIIHSAISMIYLLPRKEIQLPKEPKHRLIGLINIFTHITSIVMCSLSILYLPVYISFPLYYGSATIINALLARLLLKEPLDCCKAITIVGLLIGIVLVSQSYFISEKSHFKFDSDFIRGFPMAFGGAFSYSISSISGRRIPNLESSVVSLSIGLSGVVIGILLMLFPIDFPPTFDGVSEVDYVAVCAVGVLSFYNAYLDIVGLKITDAITYQAFKLIDLPASAMISFLLLSKAPGIIEGFGIAVVLASLLLDILKSNLNET